MKTSILGALRLAYRNADRLFDRHSPINPAQHEVLSALIATRKPMLQTDIVAATSIDRSTLSILIQTLKGRGYVTILADLEDRRANRCAITASGAKALNDCDEVRALIERRLTTAIGGGKRQLIAALIGIADMDTDDE